MILDKHKDFKGLCIEFKSPTGNYYVSEAQKEMKKKYLDNGYAFILSNDYDRICKNVHEYTAIFSGTQREYSSKPLKHSIV